ncbi:hypothetical protein B0H15DRAFT_442461 [Mycena belliarum]|uniref:Uncharacterized protein n=1 Tax=Mycena belliarum TaxID=1033014 RepID=A0AAD6XKZ3_9AGAR|nr:hypothetical protein B0H15DRAFT_442461 [Mycena belliae]
MPIPYKQSLPPIGCGRTYCIPRGHPIDSPMGRQDATAILLMQKMIADSYEHGRVVWKENKARCAITGEPESDDLPCGPNSAQKRVESYLVEAGLLDPDDSDEESEDDITPPMSPVTPATPTRRAWHRRLEIVIPPKTPRSPNSVADSANSHRSPLSPIKLWSAVQRSTSVLSLPIPTVRIKPKHIPAPPPSHAPAAPRKKCLSLGNPRPPKPRRPEAADPADSVMHTAYKRAALLGTISTADVDILMAAHHDPPPPPPPPAARPPAPRPEFEDPSHYRWPARLPPPMERNTPPPTDVSPDPVPDSPVRWYHPVIILAILFSAYILLIAVSACVVLRAVYRPLMVLVVLYYSVFLAVSLLTPAIF